MTYTVKKMNILDSMYRHYQKELAKIISERKIKKIQDKLSEIFSEMDSLYWSNRYNNTDYWTGEMIYDDER